jgi:PAS domain S-box-containing protein
MASHPRSWSGREVEELLAVLDHLPAMVAYWDRDCLNRIANAAYVEWFGMTPSQMHGMHIRDLLGPKIYQLNLPYIRGALAGESQLFNRTLVDTHGRTRYTQASYIPHLIGKRVEGFFVLVTDISERVRAEEALAESTANTALLHERQRIASDMHDLVVQSLYAAGLQLNAIARDLDPARSQRVDAVIDQIDGAISTLRESIKGLTRHIDPDQFQADIRQVVENSAAGLGFEPALTVDGPPALIPPTARPEILAVLHEALSNVIRHASATTVHVTISSLGPEVRLTVADDGCGIGEVRRASGLANMAARAQRLGGSFSLTNNDPHGTIVDWRSPSTRPDSPATAPTVRQPSTERQSASGNSARKTSTGTLPTES